MGVGGGVEQQGTGRRLKWEGPGQGKCFFGLQRWWKDGEGLSCLFLTTGPLCPLVTTMHCGGHQVGYMFLGEVALGKEYHITMDDPSLKSPPPGFDSVIARGQTEPGEPQILGRSTAKSGVDIRDWRNFRKEDSRESRL